MKSTLAKNKNVCYNDRISVENQCTSLKYSVQGGIFLARIELVKSKILELSEGSFQNLCNALLTKLGYTDIVALGSHAGTERTTKGTPDAYSILPDGKYVFVEYTTQKSSLGNKLKDDVTKCLDVTKTAIPHEMIAEIICCHTSSNVTPNLYNELNSVCKEKEIKFKMIGIDSLADSLCWKYPELVKEYLHIDYITGQIQTKDDFVKNYDKNAMAAPLDTEFLFREKELEAIGTAFDKVDVVMLCGTAGAGKTRLALAFGEDYASKNQARFLCVSSKSIPILEDVRQFIDHTGNYFIFVDDANELAGLKHIIELVKNNSDEFSIKILVTVRDYAKRNVYEEIQSISNLEVVKVNPLSDKEIVSLLETVLEIKNPDYQDIIVRLAEGNARLSMLAGKVACKEQKLEAIADATEFYDRYYGKYLQDQFKNDEKLLKTAGIIAFVAPVFLDNTELIDPLIEQSNMTSDEFFKNIRYLHDLEIFELYKNKAVQVSEQCFGNYLLKYVFYDRKLLSLSDSIRVCFFVNKERAISAVSTLLNVFYSKPVHDFVKGEICYLWKEQEEEICFLEFVKAFYPLNLTDTLIFINDTVNKLAPENVKIDEIDTKTGKNHSIVHDNIIKILCGFADTHDVQTALELFIMYLEKKPSLFMEFYHASNSYLSITSRSYDVDFRTQILFFCLLKESSTNDDQGIFVLFFLEIASHFLRVHFTPTESGRKNTISFHEVSLIETEGSKEYRKTIWEWLEELAEFPEYLHRIREILYSYNGHREAESYSLSVFDEFYIRRIMSKVFLPIFFDNSLLAKHLTYAYQFNEDICKYYSSYFETEAYSLYTLLKGPSYHREISYEEQIKLKSKSIEEYVEKLDFEQFKYEIDGYLEIVSQNNIDLYQIQEGVRLAFEAVYKNQNYYVAAINYLAIKESNHFLNPKAFISRLFTLITDDEVYKIANSCKSQQRNMWLYGYFYEIPASVICEKHLLQLYDFLQEKSDIEIKESTMRNIDFLDKFKEVDPDVILKASATILKKSEYSPFISNVYFSLLFNESSTTPSAVVEKFVGNYDLLAQIYLCQIKYDNPDLDGNFLLEIYKVYPTILDGYIDLLSEEYSKLREHTEQLLCFYTLPNYREIYDKIFVEVFEKTNSYYYRIPELLKSMILHQGRRNDITEKQDNWISHCIRENAKDRKKMDCLFSVIAILRNEKKITYLMEFCKLNENLDEFSRIIDIPRIEVSTDGFLKKHQKNIELFEALMEEFKGIKWINHKKHLEERIQTEKKNIEWEELQQILRH